MFFWNSLDFSMIQQMLAIWSLVPLPFLKPDWTTGSSQFTMYRPIPQKFIDALQNEDGSNLSDADKKAWQNPGY